MDFNVPFLPSLVEKFETKLFKQKTKSNLPSPETKSVNSTSNETSLLPLTGPIGMLLRRKLSPILNSKITTILSNLSIGIEWKQCIDMIASLEIPDRVKSFLEISSDSLSIENTNGHGNGHLEHSGSRFAFTVGYPKLLKWLKLKIGTPHDEHHATEIDEKAGKQLNRKLFKDLFDYLCSRHVQSSSAYDWRDLFRKKHENNFLNADNIITDSLLLCAVAAGDYETSLKVMIFCLYELATNKDIQRKVHEEIDKTLEAHNGKITYDSLAEMKQLHYCIDEALQKYPPVLFLDHAKTPTQSAVNSNIVIRKGMPIVVPVRTLHRTKSFCTDPANFIQNEDEETTSNKMKFDFLPNSSFNQPQQQTKNCNDFVLRLLQTKIGLVSMLHRYIYDLDTDKSDNLSNLIARILLTHPINAAYFKVSARY